MSLDGLNWRAVRTVAAILAFGACASAAMQTATSSAPASQAPSTVEQVNEANNPLTPKITVNFQDQWAPEIYGTDQQSNAFLLRGVLPQKLLGLPQILRFTLPVVTAPNGSGYTNGLGDLNLFDLFIFPGKVTIGVGPQLTIPTATEKLTGTGKWQAGLAGVALTTGKRGLLGALVTWQHSFAGPSDRPDQNGLAFQPLGILNLPKAWYLRSTATWNFDLAHDVWVIPLGAGIGKVWVLHNGTTVNVFGEPQFTVAHSGDGQPKLQLFAGVNLQFPIRRK
jgi:hypothetical protein